jgi:hypothetical protein
VNLKKILTLAFFLFAIAVTGTFGEKERYSIFECSDKFKKIKEAFRERLYDACLEKEYFYYEKDASGMGRHPLETNVQKIIDGIETKYFIFKDEGIGIYFLFLINKEDGKAIKFYFFDGGLETSKPSSQVEIDKALSLYLEL